MNKTPLHQNHLDLKAKMCPFAGWDMPIQYDSIKNEVKAVRENCGVFDVSHMGEFFVTGVDAIKFVDHLICNNFKNAPLKKAVYSPLCREDGTMIDDLIAYKLEEEKILICVNAANIKKDWQWISAQTNNFSVELNNDSDNYALLAVQGPQTQSIVKTLGLEIDQLEYYSITQTRYKGKELIIARTGYTGEDGLELFIAPDAVQELWNDLIELGVTPCGLAARDVLRLEVCYPLYGHELTDELTPLDAALKWTVKFNKEFIGKQALQNYSPKFRLVKLSLDKGIPREGHIIENTKGLSIGKITSGTMGVTIGQGIGLGLVKKDLFPEDKNFVINIRGRKITANYHAKAFYNGGHK